MVLSRPELSSETVLRNRSDLRLVCTLCAGDVDAARRQLESLGDRVDWMSLIELSRTYRLETLLHRAVDAHFGEFVSPPARDVLRKRYADNLARASDLTGHLLRVLDRLAAQQIPALPFKGPVLAAQFYGDIGLRIYADLDVLVRPCDVAAASRILCDGGYRGDTGMSLHWERSFVHETGHSVDLHWSIADKLHQFPLTPDELWARRTTTLLLGRHVPTLCPEDALLTICFNGLTEDWQRCDRIADVAEVLRTSGSIDWPRLLDRSRRHGCERLLLVGLHLAKELFFATLPESVEGRLRAHHTAIERAGYEIEPFMEFMVTSVDRRAGYDHWRHTFRMRERRWERIPYYQSFAYSLLKPHRDDGPWQRRGREALYRALRLPLLGVKHGLRALGHVSLKETDNPR